MAKQNKKSAKKRNQSKRNKPKQSSDSNSQSNQPTPRPAPSSKSQKTPYEQFENYLGKFSAYTQGVEIASNSPGVTPQISAYLSSIAEEYLKDPEKSYLASIRNVNEAVRKIQMGAEFAREDANNVAKNNLESILNEDNVAPLRDYAINEKVTPKDSYPNHVHTDIAKLQKDYKEMISIEDEKEKSNRVNAYFESRYDKNTVNGKRALGLLDAGIDVYTELKDIAWTLMIQDKIKQYQDKIKGKEASYLIANMEDKEKDNFAGYYMSLVNGFREYQEKVREAQRR